LILVSRISSVFPEVRYSRRAQAAKATPFAAGNEADVRQKRRRRLLPNQRIVEEYADRAHN
jgi:hypothetical protein